ncbi:MAG: hypothetical protein ACTHLW_09350, partial [Verrucomicrobiota bacterium]
MQPAVRHPVHRSRSAAEKGVVGAAVVTGAAWLLLAAQTTLAAVNTNNPVELPFVEFRALAYGHRNFKLTPQPVDSGRVPPARNAVRIHRYKPVSLPQQGWPLTASFDFPAGATRWAVRLRYKLEGYDPDWRDLDQYYMHLVLKFLDDRKNPISRAEFRTAGQSVGWTGDLAASKMTMRVAQASVPPRAYWMSVWIDSGGHDETTGVWLLDNLSVVETVGENAPAHLMLQEDFDTGRDLDQPQGDFQRWVRDGGDLGGAQVWLRQLPKTNHSLLIRDGNPRDYSAWRLNDQNLLRVQPGQQLTLKWEEVFSVGSGRGGQVSYPNLPNGHYQLRVQEVDALGAPTGEEAVLPLVIAPPFYTNAWFQAAVVTTLLAIGL